ncbi:MAG: monovalent cation/H(+) antiporter subunit G [Chloroflexi bacterium]|nr:monovalent cation/H(+) antiporter subunit G [Chloroflexota bacterium]
MFELLGVAALLFGLFFSAVGVIGVIRLPDVLTRLHASGKVAILGLFGLLLGAALLMPSSALRLLTLGLFVLLTSPVATHAIAASVHRRREIAQELAQELTQDSPPADQPTFAGVDVTAVLARSRIQDIIEAQERALRQHGPTSRGEDDER